jgi:cysteine-S-conjugate beta-lyase
MEYSFDEIICREGTNCIKYDKRDKYFGSNDLLPMWVADLDFKTPRFITDAINERTQQGILGYSFKPDSYYQAIVNWVKKRHGWAIEKNWILDFDGVVPSLDFIINAFTSEGDKIILQPPVYYPFFQNVQSNKREIIYNQLKVEDDKYIMDLDDLKTQIDAKTTMFILCSPHNPGGRVWTKTELKDLAAICLENNMLIVSDEIHFDLVFSGYKHVPMASVSNEIATNTITTISASKTFNIAGLTSSSVIVPDEKKRKVLKDHMTRYHMGMGNVFSNVAVEAAFTHGEQWLNELMKYLKENLYFLSKTFANEITEIEAMQPEATYLVWLNCKALGLDDHALKKFMVNKAKVGMNPGHMFGPGGEGFQRINIGCPREVLADGLKRIRNAVKSLKF